MTADTARAETDLVAAAILHPSLTELDLPGTAFDNYLHGKTWEAIRAIHRAGNVPDPAGIARAADVPYQHVTGLVVHDTTSVPIGDGSGYARAIRDADSRRRLAAALAAANQRITNPELPLDQIAADLTTAINHATGTNPAEESLSLDAFVDQPLPETEWVIPGLLARGDRLVITGPEGYGKSQLIRQLAVAAAAGIHPLTAAPATPRTVLLIDAENPKRILINTLKAMRDNLRATGHETGDRFHVARYPQGLDIGAEKDRLILHALCRQCRPDILALGPAYKLYVGGGNAREEDLARAVTSTLDGLRERYDCAVILEHHSPHAAPGQKRTTRPIGSSLWLRWPEFGVGISPAPENDNKIHRVADVEHWRGMREERDWPERLEQDSLLPWRAAAPDSWH